MKLTNILLLILIGLIGFQKIPEKKKESVSKNDTITIKKRETKSVDVIAKNENPVKHSTTFRNYFDTDSRTTIGVSHNIRIGKEYYLSGGITSRESSYGKKDLSGNLSLTKYW